MSSLFKLFVARRQTCSISITKSRRNHIDIHLVKDFPASQHQHDCIKPHLFPLLPLLLNADTHQLNRNSSKDTAYSTQEDPSYSSRRGPSSGSSSQTSSASKRPTEPKQPVTPPRRQDQYRSSAEAYNTPSSQDRKSSLRHSSQYSSHSTLDSTPTSYQSSPGLRSAGTGSSYTSPRHAERASSPDDNQPVPRCRTCNRAGSELEFRTSKSTDNPGKQFFRCPEHGFVAWSTTPPRRLSGGTASSTPSPRPRVALPNEDDVPIYCCLKCGREGRQLQPRLSRSQNNPDRPYASCPEHSFVAWLDNRGMDPRNPHCDCGRPSRRGRAGGNARVQGGLYYNCATGRCNFYSIVENGQGGQVVVSDDEVALMAALNLV